MFLGDRGLPLSLALYCKQKIHFQISISISSIQERELKHDRERRSEIVSYEANKWNWNTNWFHLPIGLNTAYNPLIMLLHCQNYGCMYVERCKDNNKDNLEAWIYFRIRGEEMGKPILLNYQYWNIHPLDTLGMPVHFFPLSVRFSVLD